MATLNFIASEPDRGADRIDLDRVLDELRAALRSSIADLAVHFLGEPNKGSRKSPWWRWGGSDGFAVCVRGPEQGSCVDFRDGWTGDPIKFVQRELHCDFIAAIKYGCDRAGIAFDQTGKMETADERAEREEKRRQEQAERDAEAEADERKRIAVAQGLWARSIPLDGTVAEFYLTETRKVPRPECGWASHARFHPGSTALILAGTDDNDTVRFVQRIRLTIDGRKIDGSSACPTKQTNGVMDGAYVRLPGAADGPLCLCEGPETGISVWAGTGHETWLSIGSITRHNPQPGRRNVICRDDDAPGTDKALKLKLAEWRATGLDVVVATPWEVRRHDKSDFNDLIQLGGVEGVRGRIEFALCPRTEPVERLTLAEASAIIGREIGAFYAETTEWMTRHSAAKDRAEHTVGRDYPDEVVASIHAKVQAKAAKSKLQRLAEAKTDAQIAAENAATAARAARDQWHDAVAAAKARKLSPDAKAQASAAKEAAKAAHEAAKASAEAAKAEVKQAQELFKAAVDHNKAVRDIVRAASEAAAPFRNDAKRIDTWAKKQISQIAFDAAGPAPVHAIRVDVSGGKTEHNLRCIVGILKWMRANGDNRPCAVLIPAHVLGDQQVDRFAQLAVGTGLTADVWRSREAKVPEGEDPMCRNLEAVQAVSGVLIDPQKSVCRQELPDGTVQACIFEPKCRFQGQKRKTPDVWFVAHNLLAYVSPSEVGNPAFIAIDESFWKVLQFGLPQSRMFGEHDTQPIALSTLLNEPTKIPDDPLKSEQLYASRVAVKEFLDNEIKLAGELEPLQHFPAIRNRLAYFGITAETAMAAYALEWDRKITPDIYPGLPIERIRELVETVKHNKMVAKLASFWKAIAHLAGLQNDERSGFVELGIAKGGNDDKYPAVRIKGHRPVNDVWDVPTLLLDATMRMEPIQEIYPNFKLTADVRIEAPHQHVFQVLDKSFSKNQLSKADGRRNVHAIICKIARKYFPKRVLVVCQLDVEEALLSTRVDANGNATPLFGRFPSNVETEHHNNISGKDLYGPGPGREGVAAIIAIGRTAASPQAVEAMGEAQRGLAVDRLPEGPGHWYPQRDAVREMADGTFIAAQTDYHPDPLCEAIRWEICEGQLIQVVGRGRGSRRTADNPVDVWLLTNAVMPIPIERLISAADLEPSASDLMMAAGGVAFTNSADAVAAYPRIWGPNPEAAKKAMQRHPDEQPYGTAFTYQRAGGGFKPYGAHFDPHMIPDVEACLTEKLGPLVRCDVAGQAKPTEEADVWALAMARMPRGVLPLTKVWLSANHRDLFGSERTAASHLADYRVQNPSRRGTNPNRDSLIRDCPPPPPKVALFKVAGQKVASGALIRHDVDDPRPELSRLLSAEVVWFQWKAPEVTENAASPTPDVPAEPDTSAVPIVPAPPAPAPRIMVVEPDDDASDVPPPNFVMDFVATIEIGAP